MTITGCLVLVGALAMRLAAHGRRRHLARSRLRGPSPTGRPAGSDPAIAARVLHEADIEVPPAQAVGAWVGLVGAAVVFGGLVAGPGAAVVAGAGAVVTPVVVLRLRAGRGEQRLAQRLPAALEAVAAALRASATLSDALRAAGEAPTGSAVLDQDLARCRRELDRGATLVQTVEAWATWRPLPEVRLAAAALALGANAGGARAQALDAVAATLRERSALGREVVALSSQARASAVVIVAAPVVFAALGLLSSPGVATFLFRTPAGLACLVAGLGLDGVASAWISRLARPSW